MKFVPFNANDHVRIKLKPEGVAIHREYWRSAATTLGRDEMPESMQPDEDGWLTIQLHSAMKIFGPHIGPCIDGLPFDVMIQIEIPEAR